MGFLGRLLGRRRGVLATSEPEERRPPEPPPATAGTQPLERPKPTPSMRVHGAEKTAGTPDYRTPHGTPSTERIHNPRRPGR